MMELDFKITCLMQEIDEEIREAVLNGNDLKQLFLKKIKESEILLEKDPVKKDNSYRHIKWLFDTMKNFEFNEEYLRLINYIE